MLKDTLWALAPGPGPVRLGAPAQAKGAISWAGHGKPSRHRGFFSLGLLEHHPFVALPPRFTAPDPPAQSPIPEPTELVLLGGGLLVAGAAVRRRRI